MKKILLLLTAGLLIPAFFISKPVLAVEDPHPQHVCDAVTQETVLKKGIAEDPTLLMAEVEGNDLNIFFNRMEKSNMLVGSVDIDKLYIFYSENHPHWVYVYFLSHECIINVKFTYKNLVQYFITGDENLVRKIEQ